MPPKGKTLIQIQPHHEEEEDDKIERLENLIAAQRRDTTEAMEQQQQAMMKHIEELITNRLSPMISLNPTPATTPLPPISPNNDTPREIPAPPTPTALPTIPTIDKLKGRSNYQTWTINILQMSKIVQEFSHINYDEFSNVEAFQQRILTLDRQITENTTSLEEAYYAITTAHILNGIGRADSTIKGQIEAGLDGERFEYNSQLRQQIFNRLYAFRNPHGSRNNINNVNNKPSNSKDCKICNLRHGPTCWVEHPEKAPKERQKHFRKLKEQLLPDKQKADNEKEESNKLGLISFFNQPDSNDLYLASGSPCHIIKDKHLFTKLQPFRRKFAVANGTSLESHGIGEIRIYSPRPIDITNVYYCPKAIQNLISMEQIFERGMEIRPKGQKPYNKADLLVNGKHFFNLELRNSTIRIITVKHVNTKEQLADSLQSQ